MRLIIAISLFLILLSVGGYAFAAPCQSCGGRATVQAVAAPCSDPEVATFSTYRYTYTNPHSGWQYLPVEETLLRCSTLR
jgi:hypothetical protein